MTYIHFHSSLSQTKLKMCIQGMNETKTRSYNLDVIFHLAVCLQRRPEVDQVGPRMCERQVGFGAAGKCVQDATLVDALQVAQVLAQVLLWRVALQRGGGSRHWRSAEEEEEADKEEKKEGDQEMKDDDRDKKKTDKGEKEEEE